MNNKVEFKDKITTNLSFAVLLFDDFTKRDLLIGVTRVVLNNYSQKAIKNPSGYYLFLDLVGDIHTVQIENKNYVY